jgi:hypothetical protein
VALLDGSRLVFELQAGGPDDADGSRTAAVLTAYLYAEQMRTFRQLLWPRLGALGAGWLILGSLTSLFSRTAFVGGILSLLAVAIVAAIAEWRASEHLSELLRVHSAIVHSEPSSSSSL